MNLVKSTMTLGNNQSFSSDLWAVLKLVPKYKIKCYYSITTTWTSGNFYNFFLQVGLVRDTYYFPLQSLNWHLVLVGRGEEFRFNNHIMLINFSTIFSTMWYHFTQFVGKDNVHIRCLVISRSLLLVAKWAIYRDSKTLTLGTTVQLAAQGDKHDVKGNPETQNTEECRNHADKDHNWCK